MPKPASLPTHATDTNFSSGPDSGTPTKVEASSGQKAQGFVPGSPFAGQWWNWLLNLIYQWISWFDSLNLDSGYRLGAIVVFTSSGTWTRPANVRAVRVTCVGGGGGGGYAGAAAAGEWTQGSGGGGGGTAIKLVTSPGATETVTVGAGGAGGTAGGSSAADGQDSSFGTHCVARRGSSGLDDNSAVATGTHASLSGGAGGATGFTGDITINGQPGGGAVVQSFGGFAHTNKGGDSTHGRGGAAPGSLLSDGANGGLYGSGGSGANCTNNGSGTDGGDGRAGIVIVEEFY